MKRQPLSYALIRFQPDVAAEEFVNVGVVLVAPQSGFLDYRLETSRLSRVTKFFASFEPKLLRQVFGV